LSAAVQPMRRGFLFLNFVWSKCARTFCRSVQVCAHGEAPDGGTTRGFSGSFWGNQ